MKTHRFLGDFNLTSSPIRITDQGIISQVKKVLRLKKGDELALINTAGNEVLAVISGLNNDWLEAEIKEKLADKTDDKGETILVCAILKKENFEWVVQKATELGIKKIVPLITDRTVKLGLNQERLDKVAKEASEQSGRTIVPQILSPQSWEQVITMLPADTVVIFCHQTGDDFSPDWLRGKKSKAIFIGPEGGWTPTELKMARERGWLTAKISHFTLRAETAAIIGSFLIVNQ